MKWKECTSLPVPISVPQVVKIGNRIYVGGGLRRRDEFKNVLMYNLDQDDAKWTQLEYCSTYWHSLAATKNDELIVIGGIERASGKVVNSVYTYGGYGWIQADDHEIAPMPTAKFCHSSKTYQKNLIIVAGGYTHISNIGEKICSDAVEVYIVKNNQWLSTEPLPFPLNVLSLKIINDKCYVEHINEDKESSYSSIIRTESALSTFLEHAERGDASQCSLKWGSDRYPVDLLFATIGEIEKLVFAFGGSYVTLLRYGINFIHAYDPEGIWMKCTGKIIALAKVDSNPD